MKKRILRGWFLKQTSFLSVVFLVFSWSQIVLSTPSSKNILKGICSSTCSGRFARIIPWAEPDGSIKLYEFWGDIESCSHPSLIVYDSQGKEKLTIPEHPIDPGNKKEFARDQKLTKKHKILLRGLKETNPVFCADVK